MRDVVGPCRVGAHHAGLDLQRLGRHRQHPAPGAEQPADQVQALHRVAEQVPQRDDEQVAQRVPAQRAGAGEAVLQDVAPLVAPLAVVAQRGQGHPQVARRQDVELLRAAGRWTRRRRPTVTTAVIRSVTQPQRGERRRQTVTAAERDDARGRSSLPPQVAVHEDGGDAVAAEQSRQRLARSATDRCFPPVQPTASVT